MNTLLDRLDAVEVDAVSVISDYDKSVCEQFQKKFKDFVTFADKYLRFIDRQGIEAANDLYVDYEFQSPERMKQKMNEQVKKATNSFIGQIVYHFQRNYNVTIDSNSIREKYDHDVTYQDIVCEIVEQLGGLNFEEKAVQEIKEKLRKDISYGYSSSNSYEVKRNKAKLTIGGHYMYWEAAWSGNGQYRPSGYDCSQQRHLFNALSHFECGTTDIMYCFSYLCRHDDRSTWFDKDEFEFLNKVKATKFYKNGKVDIFFSTPELAQQFAREYLNKEV